MTEKSTQIRLRKDMIMELRKHKADGESDSATLRKILNENKRLKEEAQKKQNQFFYGALIGGTGGVVITSLVFGLVCGLCK